MGKGILSSCRACCRSCCCCGGGDGSSHGGKLLCGGCGGGMCGSCASGGYGGGSTAGYGGCFGYGGNGGGHGTYWGPGGRVRIMPAYNHPTRDAHHSSSTSTVYDVQDGYVSYTDGAIEDVKIVNYSGIAVDILLIDHESEGGSSSSGSHGEVKNLVVTIPAQSRCLVKLPQGGWIRAKPADGGKARLFFTESFERRGGLFNWGAARTVLPEAALPRTLWFCPMVHYETHRAVVGVHLLSDAHSIQPAYVDSSGGVHEKRPVNRIKELMAKARAAAAAIRLQGMVQRPPRRARKSQKALAAGQGAQKKERRKTVRSVTTKKSERKKAPKKNASAADMAPGHVAPAPLSLINAFPARKGKLTPLKGRGEDKGGGGKTDGKAGRKGWRGTLRATRLGPETAKGGRALVDCEGRAKPGAPPAGHPAGEPGKWHLTVALVWVWVTPGSPDWGEAQAVDRDGKASPETRPNDDALRSLGGGSGSTGGAGGDGNGTGGAGVGTGGEGKGEGRDGDTSLVARGGGEKGKGGNGSGKEGKGGDGNGDSSLVAMGGGEKDMGGSGKGKEGEDGGRLGEMGKGGSGLGERGKGGSGLGERGKGGSGLGEMGKVRDGDNDTSVGAMGRGEAAGQTVPGQGALQAHTTPGGATVRISSDQGSGQGGAGVEGNAEGAGRAGGDAGVPIGELGRWELVDGEWRWAAAEGGEGGVDGAGRGEGGAADRVSEFRMDWIEDAFADKADKDGNARPTEPPPRKGHWVLQDGEWTWVEDPIALTFIEDGSKTESKAPASGDRPGGVVVSESGRGVGDPQLQFVDEDGKRKQGGEGGQSGRVGGVVISESGRGVGDPQLQFVDEDGKRKQGGEGGQSGRVGGVVISESGRGVGDARLQFVDEDGKRKQDGEGREGDRGGVAVSDSGRGLAEPELQFVDEDGKRKQGGEVGQVDRAGGVVVSESGRGLGDPQLGFVDEDGQRKQGGEGGRGGVVVSESGRGVGDPQLQFVDEDGRRKGGQQGSDGTAPEPGRVRVDVDGPTDGSIGLTLLDSDAPKPGQGEGGVGAAAANVVVSTDAEQVDASGQPAPTEPPPRKRGMWVLIDGVWTWIEEGDPLWEALMNAKPKQQVAEGISDLLKDLRDKPADAPSVAEGQVSVDGPEIEAEVSGQAGEGGGAGEGEGEMVGEVLEMVGEEVEESEEESMDEDEGVDEEGDEEGDGEGGSDEEGASVKSERIPGRWVMRNGEYCWKEQGEVWTEDEEEGDGEGEDGDGKKKKKREDGPPQFTQVELQRPEVLDVVAVQSVNVKPKNKLNVTIVNAESARVEVQVIQASGNRTTHVILGPKRKWKGRLAAGTWLALVNLSDGSDPLFFEETLVPSSFATRTKKRHPPGASARTCWMVPHEGRRGYDVRLEVRLVSAIDGRLLPIGFPHKGDLEGPEVIEFTNVNSTGKIDTRTRVVFRNTCSYPVEIEYVDHEGKTARELTLKPMAMFRTTVDMGSWRRPVKSGDADGKTKLYFEEIMDYTGPGFPAYTPKGASPRVFWMAPYKSDQMWEPKLYIRPTKTVKAAVIDVDLSASQDIGFLSLLMMNS